MANVPTQAGGTGVQNPSTQPEGATKPESKAEPIESTVVKTFYSPEGQLLEPGSTYVYKPVEDQPYPWPILRPHDKKLEKELKEEYDEHKRAKRGDLFDKRDTRRLISKLSSSKA
jgi:hypothetical protein